MHCNAPRRPSPRALPQAPPDVGALHAGGQDVEECEQVGVVLGHEAPHVGVVVQDVTVAWVPVNPGLLQGGAGGQEGSWEGQ